MTRFILRSIAKAGRLIENPLAMNGSYRIPNARDTRHDIGRVLGDMKTIGRDLNSTTRKELNKYGR